MNNLDSLKIAFDSVLKELADKQKELLKELPKEDVEKYKRNLKRIQDMAKKGDVNGLNKLKNSFK